MNVSLSRLAFPFAWGVWLTLAGALAMPSRGLAAESVPGSAPAVKAPGLAAAQGRKHPSYQVFAAQLKLPEIRCGGPEEVVVLGEEVVVFKPDSELASAERALLCRSLRLPEKVLLRIKSSLDATAKEADLAQQLRTTVTDYLFLMDRWTAYRPSAGREEAKMAGLRSLEAGDLAEAWELYLQLSRPAAPAALRIIPGN